VVAAYEKLRSILDTMPNGVSVGRDLGLDELERTLQLEPLTADAARRVRDALQTSTFQRLQPYLDALRHEVSAYAGALAAADEDMPQRIAQAAQDVATFLEQRPERSAGPIPHAVTEAYRLLVETHPSPRLMEPVQAELSHPNQILSVRGSYLAALGRRDFSVPFDINAAADGATIRGQGTAWIDTQLELLPSDHDALIHVNFSGYGRSALTAWRNRATVWARGRQNLLGLQVLRITPAGVVGVPAEVNLTNRSTITGICLNLRCHLARKIAEPIARRAVAQRLPTADARAAARAETFIEQRATEEGYDIAYRINGMFQRSYWARFAARDIDPRLRVRSAGEGVEWIAEYAQPWQLAAPGPPPPIPDPRPDIVIQLHESALNNCAAGIAGQRVDEASFYSYATNTLKLEADDSLPDERGRIPTALLFDQTNPWHFTFEHDRVNLVLRFVGCETDGKLQRVSATPVEARYRIEADAEGFRVVREDLRIEGPLDGDQRTTFSDVVQRFFRRRARSGERFQQSNFAATMRVRLLTMQHGWLSVGMSHVASAPPDSLAPDETTPDDAETSAN
jgi:hypothetical protein